MASVALETALESATDSMLDFAISRQRQFESQTSPSLRKDRGHFGTPAVIAKFMAEMFEFSDRDRIRLLDPGAGVGVLSAALCERLLERPSPRHIQLELWENDPALIPFLRQTLSHCQLHLRKAGRQLEFEIHQEDFILSNAGKSLFRAGASPRFDYAILNPPYFKLSKESPQARAMEHVVRGQPNIYALFMAVATDLLVQGGQMAAITPRSYFNGLYFKRFRKWLLDRMSIRQIHLFESRKEAFKEDAVLQESVIVRFAKERRPEKVVLTTSSGRALSSVDRRFAKYEEVLTDVGGDLIVRAPMNGREQIVIETIDSLPRRFRESGYEISTGPVVTFRATEFLRGERASDTAPLFWMHNVRPFVTRLEPKNGKPAHIEVSPASQYLLVPSKTYLLLKRFTAKEEKRRLVAGMMTADDSYSNWVGLENHLNYVYRKDRDLSPHEALGLAAYFNSSLVDRYFRAISGNTQVNATEIRNLPIPDSDKLCELGESVANSPSRDYNVVEECVRRVLNFASELFEVGE